MTDEDYSQVLAEGSNHLLQARKPLMRGEPFTIAGTIDDDLIAGVGQPVEGAVAQDGSSKRLSHSSTALLDVMTKLETRCRMIMSW